MTVHITEAELARDLHTVLAKVQEVIVEQDHRPVAVIRTPQGPARKISECIALAKAHEERLGQAPTLDPDFAADVEEIIRNRKSVEPARVGLILDSSVVIAGERQGHTVRQILE
jgi:hypothetical protein